jgi:phosphotriesterase-related protein
VISHLDAAYNLNYQRDVRIAKQGFYIGYDHIGTDPDWSPQPYAMKDTIRVEMVKRIVDDGLVEHLVLANDTNAWSVGLTHRGTPEHTFAHLLRSFVPALLAAGVTHQQVHTMLVDTPRNLLPIG